MLPKNTVEINDEKTAAQMLRLMDALEDHDDVNAVYANYEISDEIMEKME
jgi:transcriptional/translational regulatory protein YebC/TACO1